MMNKSASSNVRHLIIGGAQRSATTFLTTLLDTHPAIALAQPVRPEPKFFLRDDYKTQSYMDYLNQYFSERSGQTQWLCEKSTSYIEAPHIGADMAEFLGQSSQLPKLIFVLRNPVERAISNYHFSAMHGYESADIDTALLREIDAPEMVSSSKNSGTSVSPQAYLARGRYIDFLPGFFEALPADNILLLNSERLTQDPSESAKIFNFLSLEDRQRKAGWNSRVNASQKSPKQNLSQEACSRLKDFFKSANQTLSERYNFDNRNWI